MQAASSLKTAADSLVQAQYYYGKGTLFLAVELLNPLQSKAASSKEDSLFLGEVHEWLALCYYDQGLITQSSAAIEQMFAYKKPYSKAYYVEYIAHHFRVRAVKFDYENITQLIDTVKQVYHTLNATEKQLIDTIYFGLNVENIYRNYFQGEQTPDYFSCSLPIDRIERAVALKKKIKQLPQNPLKPIYAIFVGNFLQDFVADRALPDSLRNYLLKECLITYELAIQWSGFTVDQPNYFGGRAKLLQALQYSYFDAYDSAYEKLQEGMAYFNVTIQGAHFFRGAYFALHAYQYCYANFKKTNNLNGFKTLTNYAEELDRMRFYYNENYRKNQYELFINGYVPQAQIEEIGALFSLLQEDSTNASLQNELWQNMSTALNYESFYHRTRLQVGQATYDSLANVLLAKSFELSKLLDAHLLATNEEKLQLEPQISTAKKQFNKTLQSNSALANLVKGKTLLSLQEAQKELYDDEAQLHFIQVLRQPNICVLIVQKNSIKARYISFNSALINKWLNYQNEFLKNQLDTLQKTDLFYEIYQVVFEPILPELAGVNRLHISGLGQKLLFPLSQIPIDSKAYYFQKPKLLLHQFAITQVPNFAVNYMNRSSYVSGGPNIIATLSDSFQQRSPAIVPIPFSTELVTWLKSKFSRYQEITSANKFLKLKQAALLHLSTHGQQISSIRSNHNYENQSAINENYILFDDKRVSIADVNTSTLRANLVVLGSCDVGHGVNQVISGSYNFGKVFLSNGSQCVIKSAYPIDDYATAAILKKFYEYFLSGEYASVALQKAKLDFIETVTDPQQLSPFYWASLVLEGSDIRLEIPFWKKYQAGILIISLIVLAVLGATWWSTQKLRF